MPKPKAICIENLNARAQAARYLRCVALVGRQPGLRLDQAGRVLWKAGRSPTCELWVSADDRLILYRQEGMQPVQVERLGRSLEVPFSKPVVLADQDQITVGRRKLRVHIHGEAQVLSAPSALPVNPGKLRRLARTATAAAMIGAVMTVGSCDALSTVEVRETPPVVAIIPETPTPTIDVRDFPPEPTMPSETPTPTIEVRDFPPTATAPIHTQQFRLDEVIQGAWMAAQVYDLNGEQAWVTGTLHIEGASYAFEPLVNMPNPSVEGVLDFLFVYPTGEVSIEYAAGLTAEDAFEGFAPGESLATLIFHPNAEVVRAFEVRMRDETSLQFANPAGEEGLWNVVKEIK